MNRQVVKSDHATITIPEIELELPALSQRLCPGETKSSASLTTVEGLLGHIIHDLSIDQEHRQSNNPQLYTDIQRILNSLQDMLDTKSQFTLILDDPSGQSCIEALVQSSLLQIKDNGQLDSCLFLEQYTRTKEQTEQLGFSSEPTKAIDDSGTTEESIYEFTGDCPSCQFVGCKTRMHPLDIPYFKQVIIMATVCDACEYKNSEVRSGSAISEKGKRLTLHLKTIDDLSRDILKSETCSLTIPEINLELEHGTLGGRFTTIEGILDQVKTELSDKLAPFSIGDSASSDPRYQNLSDVIKKLDQIISGSMKCAIILDDPLSNSYIQNINAPEPDPQLIIEEYDRTFDQNESLGLNDIEV